MPATNYFDDLLHRLNIQVLALPDAVERVATAYQSGRWVAPGRLLLNPGVLNPAVTRNAGTLFAENRLSTAKNDPERT